MPNVLCLSAIRAGVIDSASCVVAVSSQYREYAYRQAVPDGDVLWRSTASTGIMPIDRQFLMVMCCGGLQPVQGLCL